MPVDQVLYRLDLYRVNYNPWIPRVKADESPLLAKRERVCLANPAAKSICK